MCLSGTGTRPTPGPCSRPNSLTVPACSDSNPPQTKVPRTVPAPRTPPAYNVKGLPGQLVFPISIQRTWGEKTNLICLFLGKKAHSQRNILRTPCNILSNNILAACTLSVGFFVPVTPDRECPFSLEVSFYVCIQILRLWCLFLPSFRTFSAALPVPFLRSLAWGKRFHTLLSEVSEAFTPAERPIEPSICSVNRLQDLYSRLSMNSWHLMPASALLKSTLSPPCSSSSDTTPFISYHFLLAENVLISGAPVFASMWVPSLTASFGNVGIPQRGYSMEMAVFTFHLSTTFPPEIGSLKPQPAICIFSLKLRKIM